jgi:hypothetical protein
MIDISQEIEMLERCASECELIAGLATDQRARYENENGSRLFSGAPELTRYSREARAYWNASPA